MKREFSYSSGDHDLVIYSHSGVFFLEHNKTRIAKSDDIKILKSYIDGFMYGFDYGSEKWFKSYMEAKQKIRQMEVKN